MNRLTERTENGCAVYKKPTPEPEGWKANRHEVLQRLAEYEDTGLEPEEINKELFSRSYFNDLYDLCNRVYKEKREVKSFNEYVKGLILKELDN